jgi:uncharacterized protein YndB with AHSA1/START domain
MSGVPPVRKQILVAASQEHAFRVFTDGIDRWWPRQHHIGASPLKRQVLEPRLGGRWYSVCEDGSECDVGRVLVWEPPRRLVLSWQITAEWRHDATFVTEVEVTFTAEGARRTRVELEHRLLERYGDAAPALREQIDKPGGWGATLESFARAAGGEP